MFVDRDLSTVLPHHSASMQKIVAQISFALLTYLAVIGEAAEVVCEPNLTIYRGCNTCTCSRDGAQLACTALACPPDQQPVEIRPGTPGVASGFDVVCRAGQSFPAVCNTCRCNNLGTKMGCTRRLCLQSDYAKLI